MALILITKNHILKSIRIENLVEIGIKNKKFTQKQI